MARDSLPVDALLPEVEAALTRHRFVVLEAAPGAGKTTRVPWFLAELRKDLPGQVVVTEPRRIAARLAAHFVASELGETVGDSVGYSVRFEERTSRKTRLRYVTEGVLLRQLLDEPTLASAHTLVIDEFHERHLSTDQLLAYCRALTRTRPELRIVVMSATLDAEPLARFLDDCPRIQSPGRSYPLRVENVEFDDRPLERRVASAVRRAVLENQEGNVLVFLPGLGEIQRCKETLDRTLEESGAEIVILHGEQPIADQAKAVARGTRRRVILSTNVAESSVTVDGVRCVVDSGLARVATHSPWTGATTLRVERVSQSSAIQRSGRAARQGPGTAFRLYPESDFATRPEQQAPEIERTDLAQLLLECLGAGFTPEALEWLTPPPAAALNGARLLLSDLGAVDGAGALSPIGRRMLGVPLAPRLARVLIAADDLGVGDDGALAVALVSERDIHDPKVPKSDLPTNDSDVQDRLDRYRQAEVERFSRGSLHQLELDAGRVREVQRSYERLRRSARGNDPHATLAERETRLRQALLAGFPDRVARRKSSSRADLILASGNSARLADESVVRTQPFLLALDIEDRVNEGRRSGPLIRWASAVDPEWLLEAFPERITTSDDHVYASERGRVETVSRMLFGSVALEESRLPAAPSAEVSETLYLAVKDQLTTLVGRSSSTETLRRRIQLLREYARPEGLVSDELLSDEALLREACRGLTRFDELKQVDLEQSILSHLTPEQARQLRQDFPPELVLPGGRRVPIQYEPGKPPWIASRLQDFFGMVEGPRIARGKLALTIHLLAPNQRAVQVTSDLAGFWERHYTEVRKELRRRYPRHAWPEDGRSATPPEPKVRPRG